jgi:general secretion pathway protein D
MLRSLDAMPNQVLIEATIAEVALTDDLKFGIRWFFEDHRSEFNFSDAVAGAVVGSFPGFSYLLAGSNARVVLNAVATVTDVDVISSPSLMVLDNRQAVLQVGDQVQIVTKSVLAVQDPAAPVVNSVQMKDTGIILTVTPRVADSGRVLLDIEQEVSDVVATTTSNIDSPTIKQRKVKTTVVVNDGDSLVLGGLMQQGTSRVREKVPLLCDIPVLGSAFRTTKENLRRTELLILITPRVVRDLDEAGRVTEEFRQELREVSTKISRKRHTPLDTAKRILE